MSGDMFIWDYEEPEEIDLGEEDNEDEEPEEIDPREHWLEFPEDYFLETQLRTLESLNPDRLERWKLEADKGSEEAIEKLIMSVLRSAAWIAQHYSEWSSHNREDLTQEAMFELTRRTRTKKEIPQGYYKFAKYSIISGILRTLCDTGFIRIPRHIQEKLWKIRNYLEQKTKQHGDEAPEIFLEQAANRHLKPRAAQRIRRIMQVYDFNQNPQAEVPESYETQVCEEPAEDSELISMLLDYLTPRQRTVIQRRILEGKTLTQIAEEMNRVPERIRQIEEEALKKLREIATHKTEPYIDETPQHKNGLYAPQIEIRVEDLPPLEQKLFRLRYFQKMTKEQIAKELALTPEKIELTTRRAEKRIICGPRYT